jgi:hypothetical protein
MKPGDVVRLVSFLGQTIRVVSDIDPAPLKNVREYPHGTLAMLVETWISDEREGPSMDSYAKILVGGHTGYVWLYECEELQ